MKMLRTVKDKLRMKLVEAAAIGSAMIINMQINRAVDQIEKERGLHDNKKLSVR